MGIWLPGSPDILYVMRMLNDNMAKTRSYAGSEKCELASSDVVFGISDNIIYNDYMSIIVNEANQSEMRNEFPIQTLNASATDRPS